MKTTHLKLNTSRHGLIADTVVAILKNYWKDQFLSTIVHIKTVPMIPDVFLFSSRRF
jgi:hypothetical protein